MFVWPCAARGVACVAQVRACFECEAAAISTAICIPEVVARDELMKDERFQVKRNGKVVGCKCICTTCKTNAFVLVDAPNVNSKTRVRFAYGNNQAIMPVALDYVCVHAECAAVQRKLKPEQLTELQELTQHGLEQVPRLPPTAYTRTHTHARSCCPFLE